MIQRRRLTWIIESNHPKAISSSETSSTRVNLLINISNCFYIKKFRFLPSLKLTSSVYATVTSKASSAHISSLEALGLALKIYAQHFSAFFAIQHASPFPPLFAQSPHPLTLFVLYKDIFYVYIWFLLCCFLMVEIYFVFISCLCTAKAAESGERGEGNFSWLLSGPEIAFLSSLAPFFCSLVNHCMQYPLLYARFPAFYANGWRKERKTLNAHELDEAECFSSCTNGWNQIMWQNWVKLAVYSSFFLPHLSRISWMEFCVIMSASVEASVRDEIHPPNELS